MEDAFLTRPTDGRELCKHEDVIGVEDIMKMKLTFTEDMEVDDAWKIPWYEDRWQIPIKAASIIV